MRKNTIWATTITIFISMFLFDRFTKKLALAGFFSNYSFFNCLSFDLIINRGISLGLFNSPNSYNFLAISILVSLISIFLIYFTRNKINSGSLVIGETLILSGALSNIVDRVIHNGVIDFIVFSIGKFNLTVFNFADICIVFGAILMFINNID